ncbi:MAG: hypothetical protein AAFO59_11085, partial [Cyanobacteria bacterium J06607_17]
MAIPKQLCTPAIDSYATVEPLIPRAGTIQVKHFTNLHKGTTVFMVKKDKSLSRYSDFLAYKA